MLPADTPSLADYPWHQAATLEERVNWSPPPLEVDESLAAERLEVWLASLHEHSESSLDPILSMLGIDRIDFVSLLGETEPSLLARRGSPPGWYRTFSAYWRAGLANPASQVELPESSFVTMGRPLLVASIAELEQRIFPVLARHDENVRTHLGGPERTIEMLGATIPIRQLEQLLHRSLVLELNIQRVHGNLVGRTGADRYDFFLRSLSDPARALSIWVRHPVLARKFTEKLTSWLEATERLCHALVVDVAEFAPRNLLPMSPSRLCLIDPYKGDQHCGGLSVTELVFDTGSVFFKPRPLGTDVAFGRFAGQINELVGTETLRAPVTWDRGDHGWSANMARTSTLSGNAPGIYAYRLGFLSGMLHAIGGTDFHCENIVACDDYPVAVDFETLFHPTDPLCSTGSQPRLAPGDKRVQSSVYRTGVLPTQMVTAHGTDVDLALDVSPMSPPGPRRTMLPVAVDERAGTDELRIRDKRAVVTPARSLPVDPDGRAIYPILYSDDYLIGLDAALRAIRQNREEFTRLNGLLSLFLGQRVRVIVRPTFSYSRILSQATHPDHMRDGIDYDRSLCRTLTVDRGDTRLSRSVGESEISQMRNDDIPIFMADISTGVVFDGQGRRIGTLDVPPIQMVSDELAHWDGRRCEQEAWIARASIACARANARVAGPVDSPESKRTPDTDGPLPSVSSQDLLQASAIVAKRLRSSAVAEGKTVDWMSVELVSDRFWRIATERSDLYGGVCGIAHALDVVSRLVDDDEVEDLAHSALLRVEHLVTEIVRLGHAGGSRAESALDIAGFGMTGGCMYALAHASRTRPERDWVGPVRSLLPLLARRIDNAKFDFVDGMAGFVMSLLTLNDVAPDHGVKALAERCVWRLIDHCNDLLDTGGAALPGRPALLCGVAHGASGLLLALASYHSLEPADELLTAILKLLHYEESMYSTSARNWPDLRTNRDEGTYDMKAWCHGSPGITLVRRRVRPMLQEGLSASTLRDAEGRGFRSAEDSCTAPATRDESLCHGLLGNLVIMQELADDRYGSQDLTEFDPEPIIDRLDLALGRPWRCGGPTGLEIPGLMNGLAGVSWALARLARPGDVANVLTLDPPRRTDHDPPTPPTACRRAGGADQ